MLDREESRHEPHRFLNPAEHPKNLKCILSNTENVTPLHLQSSISAVWDPHRIYVATTEREWGEKKNYRKKGVHPQFQLPHHKLWFLTTGIIWRIKATHSWQISSYYPSIRAILQDYRLAIENLQLSIYLVYPTVPYIKLFISKLFRGSHKRSNLGRLYGYFSCCV